MLIACHLSCVCTFRFPRELGNSSRAGVTVAPQNRLSWWNVFVPFFAADGLSTYFTTIVSVRLFQDGEKRLAVLRLFWVLTVLSLKFVFEMLLCQKLVEQTRELWFGLITSPAFILLQLLMIRACRVN